MSDLVEKSKVNRDLLGFAKSHCCLIRLTCLVSIMALFSTVSNPFSGHLTFICTRKQI